MSTITTIRLSLLPHLTTPDTVNKQIRQKQKNDKTKKNREK